MNTRPSFFQFTPRLLAVALLLSGCASPGIRITVGDKPEDVTSLDANTIAASCGNLGGWSGDRRGVYIMWPTSDAAIRDNGPALIMLRGLKVHGMCKHGSDDLLVLAHDGGRTDIYKINPASKTESLWCKGIPLNLNDLVAGVDGKVYAVSSFGVSLAGMWKYLVHSGDNLVIEAAPDGTYHIIATGISMGAGIAVCGDKLLVSSCRDYGVYAVDMHTGGEKHPVASNLGLVDNINVDPHDENVFYVASHNSSLGLFTPFFRGSQVWRLQVGKSDDGWPRLVKLSRLCNLPDSRLVSNATPDEKGRLFIGHNRGTSVEIIEHPVFEDVTVSKHMKTAVSSGATTR